MADSSTLDGYWLPFPGAAEIEIRERAFGPEHIPLRVAELTPRRLREGLTALKHNRATYLLERPVMEILAVIEAAATHMTRPGGAARERLLDVLPGLSGYSRPMIERGLEQMAAGWTVEALRGALEAEFGTIQVLDDFQPRATSGFQRAYGAELTVHVFSGNIPGVSVTSLLRALCVKSASFGKSAAGEPLLAVCFCRALAEVDPGVASCVGVSYWPGGSDDLEDVAFSEAGTIVAYGSDETIARIGCRVPPQARFLPYPNRVGVALVSRSVLRRKSVEALARRAALDVVTFDQQGCVSPHAFYIERGDEADPLAFGRALAAALEQLSVEIPRGFMAPAESSLIHQLRAQAEVRGAVVLASERGTEWTVIIEEREGFEPSPLNRVVQVRPVDDLDAAIGELAPVGKHLQTVALAAEGAEGRLIAEELGRIGATRIVPIGEAAWPLPHWHHDGRFQFLDLVRFTDWEVE